MAAKRKAKQPEKRDTGPKRKKPDETLLVNFMMSALQGLAASGAYTGGQGGLIARRAHEIALSAVAEFENRGEETIAVEEG